MTNSGIIGYGNWGNKLYKKLTHLSKVKFVCNSRDNYKLNLNKVDWVFVATPNNTHFKIVSECLKKKKNQSQTPKTKKSFFRTFTGSWRNVVFIE